MNTKIIEQFNLLVKQIQAEQLNAESDGDSKEITKHKFRLQQTKKVLNIIKKLDFEIKNSDDVKDIPGIGINSRNRIDEILKEGTLSELKKKYEAKKQKQIDSIMELNQIIGVGDKLAKKLVMIHKIKTIEDLRSSIKKGTIDVNDKIKLGLKYYGKVKGNIPRKEIGKIEKLLSKEMTKIDSSLNIQICGSYRRGKATSNDIDMLLYHPKIKNLKQLYKPETVGAKHYLELFVDRLTEKDYLKDHLTDKNYKMKYMGFFEYNDNIYRLDIRLIPYNSLATAMLYYTGPFELNRHMRLQAIKRNMFLNEYGLFRVEKDGTRTLIKTNTEEDVFKKLGLPYLTPEERESYNMGKIKKII